MTESDGVTSLSLHDAGDSGISPPWMVRTPPLLSPPRSLTPSLTPSLPHSLSRSPCACLSLVSPLSLRPDPSDRGQRFFLSTGDDSRNPPLCPFHRFPHSPPFPTAPLCLSLVSPLSLRPDPSDRGQRILLSAGMSPRNRGNLTPTIPHTDSTTLPHSLSPLVCPWSLTLSLRPSPSDPGQLISPSAGTTHAIRHPAHSTGGLRAGMQPSTLD